MSKNIEKQKALQLRKKGLSYSQIKKIVRVSKSTLNNWLSDYPLSKERISELRGNNPIRIERFRNTMRMKKEVEENKYFEIVKSEIGKLSKREVIISGLFLYWGEGTKAASCTTAISNTDPDLVRFYIKWLNALGIDTGKLAVRLHLYKGMNIDNEVQYWSEYLNVPKSCFRKPYIKRSSLSDITYVNGYKHGTCNVLYYGKDLYLYVKSSLKYLRSYNRP